MLPLSQSLRSQCYSWVRFYDVNFTAESESAESMLLLSQILQCQVTDESGSEMSTGKQIVPRLGEMATDSKNILGCPWP
jgi:hypothetical protein